MVLRLLTFFVVLILSVQIQNSTSYADEYMSIEQIVGLEKAANMEIIRGLETLDAQLTKAIDNKVKSTTLVAGCPKVLDLLAKMSAGEISANKMATSAFNINARKAAMLPAVMSDLADAKNMIFASGGNLKSENIPMHSYNITPQNGVTFAQLREVIRDCLFNMKTRLKIFG